MSRFKARLTARTDNPAACEVKLLDDLIKNPVTGEMRAIVAYTHEQVTLNPSQVKEVWRERSGEPGERFFDQEIPMGWERPS